MYYKSDVTFICTLLLCTNERLYCCIVQRFDVILTECNLSLHEITSVFQRTVIFMNCRIMEFKIFIFWLHFFIDTYLI